MNDDVYEFIESFNAQLSFVEVVDRVTINPGLAQVEIQDDDGKVNFLLCLTMTMIVRATKYTSFSSYLTYHI